MNIIAVRVVLIVVTCLQQIPVKVHVELIIGIRI